MCRLWLLPSVFAELFEPVFGDALRLVNGMSIGGLAHWGPSSQCGDL